ncbi:hypothetical protein RRG08_042576 [Elysia crispata]|uniref:Uncharacterized protein n=1 Tax=Elysia crispata TaxID=231223 RepID=A0AAE0XPZ4_9GAST|nr:hypothetical protein RRG08_042576 [Elysia crispata]
MLNAKLLIFMRITGLVRAWLEIADVQDFNDLASIQVIKSSGSSTERSPVRILIAADDTGLERDPANHRHVTDRWAVKRTQQGPENCWSGLKGSRFGRSVTRTAVSAALHGAILATPPAPSKSSLRNSRRTQQLKHASTEQTSSRTGSSYYLHAVSTELDTPPQVPSMVLNRTNSNTPPRLRRPSNILGRRRRSGATTLRTQGKWKR